MYECFLSTTDKINYSKPILKEYTFCATPSPLFLIRPFIKDLEKKNKICFVNQSKIITLLKRHQQKRRIICPTDKQDKKWIDIAIATKSRFIITTDNGLLCLPQIKYNGETGECLEPKTYNIHYNA